MKMKTKGLTGGVLSAPYSVNAIQGVRVTVLITLYGLRCSGNRRPG